jgi:hypothetical protein
MDNRFEVAVDAGTLRSAAGPAVSFPRRWIPEGVTVEADFTEGHLFHLAAAGWCSMTSTGKPPRWAWT